MNDTRIIFHSYIRASSASAKTFKIISQQIR